MPAARAASRHRPRPDEQRRPAGHVLGVELLGQVVGAHDQHGRGGRRRRRSPRRGAWRPGSRASPRCVVRSGAPPASRASRSACTSAAEFDLGDDDAVGTGGRGGAQVVVVPLGAEAVDADGELPAPYSPDCTAAHTRSRASALASGATASSRSRMRASAGMRLGLLERPLVGAGHVEHRPAGPRGASAHRRSLVLVRSRRRRPARGRRRRAASASSTITWHCLTEASSSILPSSMTAPVPSPMASMTRWAWAHVGRVGARTPAWRCRSARGAGSRRRRSRAGRRCGTGPRRRRCP